MGRGVAWQIPRHFDGQHYFNPDAPGARGFSDVLRWKFTSKPESSPAFVDDVLPSQPPGGVEGHEMVVTLINHSTVLLQDRQAHILTDPIWSDRASPFSWAGPRRRRAPGVRLEDLPRIDVVLVTHNHYDHLDLATLERLAHRQQSQYVVPAGVAGLMRSRGIGPVHELDWGESVQLGETTIHCAPAYHFSARGMFDRNSTLWCGYVIESADRIVYFAGDTAFGPHFASIRQRFGPIDAALLPIGAYEPRWFMSAVHMGPDEALRAHKILEARTSVAIHHGTFQLGDEAIDTPKNLLSQHATGESFLTLDNGQSLTLP